MLITPFNILIFCLCMLLCAWLIFYFRINAPTKKQRGIWCPELLLNAQLVYAEKDFSVKLKCEFKGRITGRPDQVFRLKNGQHIPVEYKTRMHFQIYNTDIAQLSFYAFLLRRNGLETASYGYTVIENRLTRERNTLKVELWNDDWVIKTLMRYEALAKGATPSFSFTPKCLGCVHKERCHSQPEPEKYRLQRRK